MKQVWIRFLYKKGCGSAVEICPEVFELAGEVAVVKSGR